MTRTFISRATRKVRQTRRVRRTRTFLRQKDRNLTRLVRTVGPANDNSPSSPQLLLVISRFRSLFGPSIRPDFRRRQRIVISYLLTTVRRRYIPIRIILNLQTSCLNRLRQFPTLCTLITRRKLAMPAVACSRIGSAVIGPLRGVNLHCSTGLVCALLLSIINTPKRLTLLRVTLGRI